MGSNVSIAEALAQLESKVAYHKGAAGAPHGPEAHHAGQQAFHAEQKGIHEAEHRKAVERHETFKAASESIGGMLVDVKPPAPARWGAKLKHGIEPRSVSATLRRWAAMGRIRLRDGRS